MFWRIHEAVIGEDRVAEVTQILTDMGDELQLVRGATHQCSPYPFETVVPPIYATHLTTIQDARRAPFYITTLFDSDRYKVSYYTSLYSYDVPFLNRGGVYLTTKQVLNTSWMYQFCHRLWGTNKVFIRPNSGNKLFTGQTVIIDSQHEQELAFTLKSMDDDAMILVNNHVELSPVEWRFWIIDGKIATQTPYSWELEDGELVEHPDYQLSTKVIRVVERVVEEDRQVDVAYVVDVCIDDISGDPYILEINCINTSGVYKAPLRPLLSGLRQAIITIEDDLNGM
jgi:hypothetical protein